MTQLELEIFFMRLKGIKIKRAWFDEGDYFILDSVEYDSLNKTGLMDGIQYNKEGIGFPYCYMVTENTANEWIVFDPLTKEENINKKCDCGKEKHGFANHSDWCPMYTKVNI